MISFNPIGISYISRNNSISFGSDIKTELKDILERRQKRPWDGSVATACRGSLEDLYKTNPAEVKDFLEKTYIAVEQGYTYSFTDYVVKKLKEIVKK